MINGGGGRLAKLGGAELRLNAVGRNALAIRGGAAAIRCTECGPDDRIPVGPDRRC